MEEIHKELLQELVKKHLPKPEEIHILSDLKDAIGKNKVVFTGFKLNSIYNAFAIYAGFNNWGEYKKSVLDDSNDIKEAKQIKTEDRIKQLNIKRSKMGDHNYLKLFRVRVGVFVYIKEVPIGFIPQFLEEDKYRDILFHKNTILQLLPHPSREDLGILRFFSDELISEGNKKDIIPKNIYMNSIIIDLNKEFPAHIITTNGIPENCKQYESNFTIPNEFYNPDELFNHIGKVFQGGIYGRSKK